MHKFSLQLSPHVENLPNLCYTSIAFFSSSSSSSSEDILMYLTRQAGGHIGKGPRLSLYLSSQLMFGVTRVYQKQYDYLVGM